MTAAVELAKGQTTSRSQPKTFASGTYPGHVDMRLDKLHISNDRANQLH